MESGVYKITNKDNGKIYIGSAVNFSKRWSLHKKCLNKQKHHSRFLQSAWNKYGPEAFEFSVVCYVEKQFLEQVEQAFIDRYWDNGVNCYNVSPTVGTRLGARASEETRKKISKARKSETRPSKIDKHASEILQRWDAGESSIQICKDYSCLPGTILRLLWKHNRNTTWMGRRVIRQKKEGALHPL